ncbi:MAG: hypothetical protein DRP74_07695 [Candidatus Omnitrophota bacterium]|nr:MAG: hypothetical protein DRP74_07695 [Candidatus Omnitrophota bacterium]
MRKILVVLLASFFLFGGTVLFARSPAASNVNDIFGRGGPAGVTPPVTIIKVRYGYQPANKVEGGLVSGTVVCWDTNSADGYTVSACTTTNAVNFAGVLVTDISTADSSLVSGSGNNVGWIAVKGFALAQVSTGSATAGKRLSTSASAPGEFVTLADGDVASQDIGVLLSKPGSDSEKGAVWLY